MLDDYTPIHISSETMTSSQTAEAEEHFLGLEIQGVATRSILENISAININIWNEALESFPQFLFQLAKKKLQQQLPTAANLTRWKNLGFIVPNVIQIQTPNEHTFVVELFESAHAGPVFSQA